MKRKVASKLVSEYIGRLDLYRDFSVAVRAIFEQLLKDFKYQTLSAREKDPYKLLEKIKRKKEEDGKIYKSLDEIEDLAGVRVVFYLESQKSNFLEFIRKEFNEESFKIENRYKPGGYRATHCIFTLDKSREILPEYRKFKKLKCEIQIVSVLFHAWSEVEHDIIYKPDGNKKILDELGLNDLKADFEKTMVEYIVPASNRLERHNEIYQKMLKGTSIFKQLYNIDKLLVHLSNDQVFSMLEVVGTFYYKKSEEVVKIVQAVISKKPAKPIIIGSFGGEKYFGKSHQEVVLKCIDLIKNTRYFSTEKVLLILVNLVKNKDKEIREKSIDALKLLAKFDYNILTKSKAGYSYQKFILEFLKKWSLAEKLSNIEFTLTALKELLSSSIEGSSWTDEKTLTMNFSHVQPTEFLKKIRRESMDLIYDLYEKTSDAKLRLRLASTLEEVLRGPSNIEYSDELSKMLDDDARYLAGIYRKMIFDKSGSLIRENIAIAEEIEERMFYFSKSEKGAKAGLAKLREDIMRDPFYIKVFPMISGRAAYKGEEGYEESKKRREKDQEDIIAQISDKNFDEWLETLEILANQKEVIEEWKLGDFKRFIERLSIEKPDLANKFLENAFKKNSKLVGFSESFLIGFQVAQRFDSWDKYAEMIIKKKDVYLIGGICNSLLGYAQGQPPRKLRKNEIGILDEIVFKKKRFAFLKTRKKDDDMWYLHNRLFHSLAFNFKPQKKEIEGLLKEEIKNNPEYAQVHYNGIQFVATVFKWLDLSLISPSFKEFLLKKVVEAPNFDWHLQEFLIELCNKDFNYIIDVFKQRIKRADALQRKNKSRGIRRSEFEAIPYHLNPSLQSLISNDKNFSKKMHELIGKMTLGWSIYNWEVSRFFEALKIDRMKVFSEVVENGDDNDLMRVINAMDTIQGSDLEFCLKIVGKTDNKEIYKMIGGIMHSIGTASGEYGIADAYRDRVKLLEKYKNSDNERIKRFVNEITPNLLKSEERERKRAAEEIQLRKIQFEG